MTTLSEYLQLDTGSWNRHWRDALVVAVGECQVVLEKSSARLAQSDATAAGIVEETRQLLLVLEPHTRLSNSESQCFQWARYAVAAYVQLYQLQGGSKVKDQHTARLVREASRHLRDAIASSCLGLLTCRTREAFLAVLGKVSDGLIGDKGRRNEDLKSSLLKACQEVMRGALPSPAKAKRKRAPKKRTNMQRLDWQCWIPADFSQGQPWSNVWWWWIPADFSQDMDCQSENEISSLPGTDISALYGVKLPTRCSLDQGPTRCSPDQVSIPETYDSFEHRSRVPMRIKAATLASIDDEDPNAIEDDDECIAALHIAVCTECKAEDPDGWNDSRQMYYCVRCWKEYNLKREGPCGGEGAVNEGQEKVSSFRYEKLDPVTRNCGTEPCDVQILDADALHVTELLKDGSPCLIVWGSHTLLPRPGEHSSQCKNFFERTNFKDLFKDHTESVPRWGGLYAPKVSVVKDAFLEPLQKTSEVSAVYAAAAWGPNVHKDQDDASDWADWERFKTETRDKIRNVLRICYRHGHGHIIVSMARSSFRGLPVAEVASLWHECLLVSGDTPGLAKRVVFTLPSVNTGLRENVAFRQEFERFREVLKEVALRRDDCKMILLAGSKLCVDARLHVDVAENRLGHGVKVALWKVLSTGSHEHQLWLHLPCGRLVLAAFPGLCLSAVSSASQDVHLWKRVETKNADLQRWKLNPDGSISLAGRPHLFLTAKAGELLGLENGNEAKDNQIWQMLSPKAVVARLTEELVSESTEQGIQHEESD
mmetsp:Transcript_155563/g.274721  ORF Transcript_155563/g.274721 Transcript_155563/m.274721 type:complete len:766 (-) Transcript_155563:117-2414(-)